MTFCSNCGTQVAGQICPSCGSGAGDAGGGAAAATASGSPATSDGFLGALFDLSFTSFITTKLIKVLYVIGIAIAALVAFGVILSGFAAGSTLGIFALVVIAPLIFFGAVIYWRVVMELVIVVFRAAEHLSEIARQGRG